GMVWGTPGYMSPEQIRGERHLSCKSDVFSLGIVLQECLAGAHPTRGDQGQLVAAPPATANVAPACPAGLASPVDQMLALRAPSRPDPGTLARSFEALLTVL